MLNVENKSFIVYPSWLEPRKYTWDNVGYVLHYPLEYNKELAVSKPPEYLKKLGFPETLPSFRLIDGLLGGGIIELHAPSLRKWLPGSALSYPEGVEISLPDIMHTGEWRGNVSFLEHHTYLDKLELGRRRKNYGLLMSPEHVEELSDSVYWLFSFKKYKTNRAIKGLDEISEIAQHFGFELQQTTAIPKVLSEMVRNKKLDDREYIWFQVNYDGKGFGFHFAVLIYTSLSICPIAGSRLFTSHLLASIEGQPRFFFCESKDIGAVE